MQSLGEVLLVCVALYPVCTAALWVAGGVLFRVVEPTTVEEPEGGWPGVSVLIPAYNEESVVAISVTAALAADYPNLEVPFSMMALPTAPRRRPGRRLAAIDAAA